MPDWETDSPRLRQNLTKLLEKIAREAARRKTPTKELARDWQRSFLQGLTAPEKYIGVFRGEAGLENTGVRIGSARGTPAAQVVSALAQFEEVLQRAVVRLDVLLPIGKELDSDELAAVLDLCAWAHAEWIQIHPFANGNGRTARLWANYLAIRYGLPPFVRLRPRPDDGYAEAGAKAMKGDWRPTATVFHLMLNRFLEEFS